MVYDVYSTGKNRVPYRSNNALAVLVFLLVLTESLMSFYLMNRNSAGSILSGYSNSVYLITQKEAELIQIKHFRKDALFWVLESGRTPELSGILSSIQRICTSAWPMTRRGFSGN